MTDFNPEGVVDTAPLEGSEASSTNVNWEDKYRSEVADRVKERERYKPIAQTFAKMHPDDARAVQDFANAFASGDTDTAVRWMVDNARTLAGERFDTFISPQAQVAIGQQAVQDGQSAGLTPSQVEQLVEQRMNQFAQAQVQTQYERQIEETLAQHGLQPDTPLATAAIVAASRRSDLDLSMAIREMEDQVLSQAQQIATKRSAAGSQMGTPIVNGQASTNLAGQNMTPRERAMARLEQNGLN
ncbi:hypothetical protein UFOVP366_13 [uncultured Caudovirales phage]|uniref:Uncharacterized protein n=1 Tax=uncultured Caudovirales phage TaxID=2100421 RepID=A0A6J7X2U6_9CAUD|nr:hypothetical protein UFOVP366_13 [uncultured Caudovirales phage]